MNESKSHQPDPMMEELRQVRDEISATISELSSEERINFHRQNARKAAALRGKILVPHPSIRFAKVLVPIDQGPANK